MELERLMSRRVLLRAIAGGAASISLLPLLAACGDDEAEDGAAEAGDGATTEAAGAGATATVTAEAAAEADPGAEEGTAEAFSEESLVVYSGRNEELVGPIIERFEQDHGVEVEVRYGDTAELAALILEEGDATPADVFFAQDAGALGAVRQEELLAALPQEILDRVEPRFRSPGGEWVGISGRARVVVYNTEMLSEADLPPSIMDFPGNEQWEGQLGWAPTNGSFQAFITAMRVLLGEEAAREWLEGIQALNPKVYEGNSAIVEAVINGEIQAGFVNHYYLLRQEAEAGEDLPAANHFYTNSDVGSLVNVAGAGVLASSDKQDLANSFIEFMLTEESQEYFATETFEYPLVEGVEPAEQLPSLSEIKSPEIDLSDLADLEGTLELLRDVGVL